MAAINQIKLNSTSTTYDVNDKRISTSAVSTVSYILGSSSSSLTTISPISASNLASVLNGAIAIQRTNFNDATETGFHTVNSNAGTGFPQGAYEWGILVVIKADNNSCLQQYFPADNSGIYVRQKYWSDSWGSWVCLSR